MRKDKRPIAKTHQPKILWASQLAQAQVCEQRVVFEHKLGKRASRQEARHRQRGNRVHRRIHREATRINPALVTSERSKPWCFLATAVFGNEAPETEALRQFRDRVLRRSRLGRTFILLYYRISPTLARRLHGKALRMGLARLVLSGVVAFVRKVTR